MPEHRIGSVNRVSRSVLVAVVLPAAGATAGAAEPSEHNLAETIEWFESLRDETVGIERKTK
jgi:hypothetical protein